MLDSLKQGSWIAVCADGSIWSPSIYSKTGRRISIRLKSTLVAKLIRENGAEDYRIRKIARGFHRLTPLDHATKSFSKDYFFLVRITKQKKKAYSIPPPPDKGL